MPRNPGPSGRDTRGRKVERPFDGQCHRKSNRRSRFAGRVRVKRCGKSAPREAQATRHGKPHRVQGQIGNPGAARSKFRESETDSGYRLHRQMILSPAMGQTEFGLQPFQNQFPFPGRAALRQVHSHMLAAQQRGTCLPINSKSSCFSRCGTGWVFSDRGGRTQIAHPVHRTDGNHVRPGIFKRPHRLVRPAKFPSPKPRWCETAKPTATPGRRAFPNARSNRTGRFRQPRASD